MTFPLAYPFSLILELQQYRSFFVFSFVSVDFSSFLFSSRYVLPLLSYRVYRGPATKEKWYTKGPQISACGTV